MNIIKYNNSNLFILHPYRDMMIMIIIAIIITKLQIDNYYNIIMMLIII